MPLFLRRDIGFDTQLAANCKTIRQFDDAITRVAFGGLDVASLSSLLLSQSMSMLEHGCCTDVHGVLLALARARMVLFAPAGWPSVDAYYEGSSSALAVPDITIPTLCIQAG